MKEYDKDTLKEIISYLISDGYINISGDKYPVLNISASGNSVLRGKMKVSIKKVFAKNTANNNISTAYEKDLFEILRSLRKEISDSLKVPPFVVFSDAALKDMCVKYPLSKDEFLKVSGVGEVKAEKYGSRFMNAIENYVGKNNVKLNNTKTEIAIENDLDKFNVKKEKSIKGKKDENNNKQDTRTISYNLYKEGKSLSEIAKARDLAVVTVENHLVYCAKLGYEINYNEFVSPEHEKLIIKAVEEIGVDKLKPIKEFLPSEISYTEIKFAICKFKEGDTPLK